MSRDILRKLQAVRVEERILLQWARCFFLGLQVLSGGEVDSKREGKPEKM